MAAMMPDDVVEDAVKATIQKWMDTMLAEVERQVGLDAGHYGRPQSYEVHTDFDSFAEEATPRIIVVSLGWDTPPVMYSVGPEKKYKASWEIGVAAIASSTDQLKSRRYAYRVAAAAAGCLIANQSLDKAISGRVIKVEPLTRRNGNLPLDADRTIWAVRTSFSVLVMDVMTINSRPAEPRHDEWPEPPTILTPRITLDPQPIVEDQ